MDGDSRDWLHRPVTPSYIHVHRINSLNKPYISVAVAALHMSAVRPSTRRAAFRDLSTVEQVRITDLVGREDEAHGEWCGRGGGVVRCGWGRCRGSSRLGPVQVLTKLTSPLTPFDGEENDDPVFANIG